MCVRKEQDAMVKTIAKAGWIRSLFVLAALILGLVVSVYAFTKEIKEDLGVVVDEKIKVHRLESDLEWKDKIHAIKLQQNDMDGKLNTILERLPE